MTMFVVPFLRIRILSRVKTIYSVRQKQVSLAFHNCGIFAKVIGQILFVFRRRLSTHKLTLKDYPHNFRPSWFDNQHDKAVSNNCRNKSRKCVYYALVIGQKLSRQFFSK